MIRVLDRALSTKFYAKRIFFNQSNVHEAHD